MKKKFPDRAKELDDFLLIDIAKLYRPFINPRIGVLAINLYKHKNYPWKNSIYLTITIELEAFCLGKKTNRLFVSNPNNINVLDKHYAKFTYDFFPNCCYQVPVYYNGKYTHYGVGAIPHLNLCSVNRIDYATNLYCENKELFLKLAKATYRSGRKQDKKFKENSNIYAASKAKKRITSIYDKELYYLDKNINDEALKEEASNIIRYEVPIVKPNAEWLYRYRQEIVFDLGLFPFLDENIAEGVLAKEYESIGTSNWYSDWYFKRKIEESSYSKTIKSKLLEIAQIISQSRSVKKALENYTEGGYTIAKTQKVVEGTKDTFVKYLKRFQEIGVQALRIPDRWCCEYEVSLLENPINNVVLKGNERHYSVSVNIPSSAKMVREYIQENKELIRRCA